LLAQSWTSSGDEKLDEIIRNTQLEAKGFDSCYYIEWIPYDDLKNIKEVGEGGFATVYQGEWKNGPKFIMDNKRHYFNGGYVALKKLENSQNVSDEFLKEVNILI
jgi:serine/threonine protein kinase